MNKLLATAAAVGVAAMALLEGSAPVVRLRQTRAAVRPTPRVSSIRGCSSAPETGASGSPIAMGTAPSASRASSFAAACSPP